MIKEKTCEQLGNHAVLSRRINVKIGIERRIIKKKIVQIIRIL